MRLHLTLPELEAGESIQTGSKERVLDIQVLSSSRQPIAIAPVRNHDHRLISAVLLHEYAEFYGSTTSVMVKFKPFWCKTFTLCSAKKDSLLALIMQFDDGQYWVDNSGWKECHLTLDGPGTDPKTVYNSQFMLGELLANYPRPYMLDQVIQLIKSKYLLCPKEEEKKETTTLT